VCLYKWSHLNVLVTQNCVKLPPHWHPHMLSKKTPQPSTDYQTLCRNQQSAHLWFWCWSCNFCFLFSKEKCTPYRCTYCTTKTVHVCYEIQLATASAINNSITLCSSISWSKCHSDFHRQLKSLSCIWVILVQVLLMHSITDTRNLKILTVST